MPRPRRYPHVPYAGYEGLTDYLHQQRQRLDMTANQMSDALGKARHYISDVSWRDNGKKPPRYGVNAETAAKMAKLFDDDEHIIRVLAGLELPPPDIEASGLADRIMALSADDRELVSLLINALRGRRRRK